MTQSETILGLIAVTAIAGLAAQNPEGTKKFLAALPSALDKAKKERGLKGKFVGDLKLDMSNSRTARAEAYARGC